MKKFDFLPSEAAIKKFQNTWFLEDHIALILQSNRRSPTPRFHVTSCINERSKSFLATTRVVRAFKKHDVLKIQILHPCVNILHFVAYHAGNKGVIVDKEDGSVVCILEGDFAIVPSDCPERNRISVVADGQCTTIIKNNLNDYSYEETNLDTPVKEKEVAQDGEIMNVFNIKEKTFSWDACFYRKYVVKNLEVIDGWENEI